MMRKYNGLRALDRSIPWRSGPHRFFFWLCAACLALYLAYAAYLSQSALFVSAADTFSSLFWFAVALCAALAALLWVSGLEGGATAPTAHARLSLRAFGAGAALSGAILGVLLAANYPGGVSVDSAVQWTQAATGSYSNWHPVFHTLLLGLGQRVTWSYAGVVALQCLAVSLALGYLVATLHAWGARLLPLLLAEALAVASPILGNTLLYLWKDNAMTLGVVILFAHAVNLYYTRGAWLLRWQNAVAFGLALAFATLVRHNAFFFTLPLLLSVAFGFRGARRGLAAAAATLVAVLALVWGPLYAALNVTYPSNGIEESIGIPMTVLSNIRKLNPDALSEEARAFTDQMGDQAAWDAYQLDNYNSIKFGKTRAAVAAQSPAVLLRMALSAAAADPRDAFLAVNGVTDLVWGLSDRGEAIVTVRNSGDLPDVSPGKGRLNRLGQALESFLTAPLAFPVFGWFFNNLGVSLMLMLALALRALRRNGPSVLSLCLPTLLYNLGTMSVLCGNDARFFSYSPLLCLMSMFVLTRDLPETQIPGKARANP